MAAFTAAGAAYSAEAPSEEQPVLLQADEVRFDEALNIVTAIGNVELAQGERVVKADTISYNINTGLVSASGNVALLEPTGDTVFAEYVELTDEMAEGFIDEIRVLMSDGVTRVAADSGLRTGDNRTEFRRGVFSPCELCVEDPSRAPLWQIKSARVVHDQQEKTVTYNDAWLEFFGVPVLYTPYFEHPDPTVDRKSGVLAPTIGSSSALGPTLQVPYFWVIDPQSDLTVAPLITGKEGVVLTGQYRRRFEDGFVNIAGSGTIGDRTKNEDGVPVEETNVFRGHIDATARFDIDDNWRWGAEVERVTDKDYLRFYDFDSPRSLTVNPYAEGFFGRNYAAINAYSFQGLRANDNNDLTPIVLPLAEYHFISEPGALGDTFFFNTNAMILTRQQGRESNRISVKGGWKLPFIGPLGDVYTLTANLQADGYRTDDVDPNNNLVDSPNGGDSEFAGRIFPQLALDWRYPFVQSMGKIQQTLEPTVQLIAAANGKNPGKIPNEDSQDLEFDDTNLFRLNRFTGYDRVDSGSRVAYGLNWSARHADGGMVTAFLGQSYRPSDNAGLFSPTSGLDENFSDFVGKLEVAYDDLFHGLYRFRFDKDDLQSQRSDLQARLSVGPVDVNLGYVFTVGDRTSLQSGGFGDREEITGRIRTKLGRYWSAFASHRRDLIADDSLSTRAGVVYQDECFLIEAAGERKFYRSATRDSEDIVYVRVIFKHLGEFATEN
jgi:LPS-assembly protein